MSERWWEWPMMVLSSHRLPESSLASLTDASVQQRRRHCISQPQPDQPQHQRTNSDERNWKGFMIDRRRSWQSWFSLLLALLFTSHIIIRTVDGQTSCQFNGAISPCNSTTTTATCPCDCATGFNGRYCEMAVLACVECTIYQPQHDNATLISAQTAAPTLSFIGVGLSGISQLNFGNAAFNYFPSFTLSATQFTVRDLNATDAIVLAARGRALAGAGGLAALEAVLNSNATIQLVSFAISPLKFNPTLKSSTIGYIPFSFNLTHPYSSLIHPPAASIATYHFDHLLFISPFTSVCSSGDSTSLTTWKPDSWSPTDLTSTPSADLLASSETCMDCPEGSRCIGNGLILPLEDFWNRDPWSQPQSCLLQHSCGGISDSHTWLKMCDYLPNLIEDEESFLTPSSTFPAATILDASTTCRAGYTGLLCASCQPTYFMQAQQCLPCNGSIFHDSIISSVSILFVCILWSMILLKIIVSAPNNFLTHAVCGWILLQQIIILCRNASSFSGFRSSAGVDAGQYGVLFDLLHWSSWFLFDLESFRLGCGLFSSADRSFTGLNPFEMMYATLAIYIFLNLCLVGLSHLQLRSTIAKIQKNSVEEHDLYQLTLDDQGDPIASAPPKPKSTAHFNARRRAIQHLLILNVIFYVRLAQVLSVIFPCVSIPDVPSTTGNDPLFFHTQQDLADSTDQHSWHLRAAPQLMCYNGAHGAAIFFGVLSIVLFLIFPPMYILFKLTEIFSPYLTHPYNDRNKSYMGQFLVQDCLPWNCRLQLDRSQMSDPHYNPEAYRLKLYERDAEVSGGELTLRRKFHQFQPNLNKFHQYAQLATVARAKREGKPKAKYEEHEIHSPTDVRPSSASLSPSHATTRVPIIQHTNSRTRVLKPNRVAPAPVSPTSPQPLLQEEKQVSPDPRQNEMFRQLNGLHKNPATEWLIPPPPPQIPDIPPPPQQDSPADNGLLGALGDKPKKKKRQHHGSVKNPDTGSAATLAPPGAAAEGEGKSSSKKKRSKGKSHSVMVLGSGAGGGGSLLADVAALAPSDAKSPSPWPAPADFDPTAEAKAQEKESKEKQRRKSSARRKAELASAAAGGFDLSLNFFQPPPSPENNRDDAALAEENLIRPRDRKSSVIFQRQEARRKDIQMEEEYYFVSPSAILEVTEQFTRMKKDYLRLFWHESEEAMGVFWLGIHSHAYTVKLWLFIDMLLMAFAQLWFTTELETKIFMIGGVLLWQEYILLMYLPFVSDHINFIYVMANTLIGGCPVIMILYNINTRRGWIYLWILVFFCFGAMCLVGLIIIYRDSVLSRECKIWDAFLHRGPKEGYDLSITSAKEDAQLMADNLNATAAAAKRRSMIDVKVEAVSPPSNEGDLAASKPLFDALPVDVMSATQRATEALQRKFAAQAAAESQALEGLGVVNQEGERIVSPSNSCTDDPNAQLIVPKPKSPSLEEEKTQGQSEVVRMLEELERKFIAVQHEQNQQLDEQEGQPSTKKKKRKPTLQPITSPSHGKPLVGQPLPPLKPLPLGAKPLLAAAASSGSNEEMKEQGENNQPRKLVMTDLTMIYHLQPDIPIVVGVPIPKSPPPTVPIEPPVVDESGNADDPPSRIEGPPRHLVDSQLIVFWELAPEVEQESVPIVQPPEGESKPSGIIEYIPPPIQSELELTPKVQSVAPSEPAVPAAVVEGEAKSDELDEDDEQARLEEAELARLLAAREKRQQERQAAKERKRLLEEEAKLPIASPEVIAAAAAAVVVDPPILDVSPVVVEPIPQPPILDESAALVEPGVEGEDQIEGPPRHLVDSQLILFMDMPPEPIAELVDHPSKAIEELPNSQPVIEYLPPVLPIHEGEHEALVINQDPIVSASIMAGTVQAPPESIPAPMTPPIEEELEPGQEGSIPDSLSIPPSSGSEEALPILEAHPTILDIQPIAEPTTIPTVEELSIHTPTDKEPVEQWQTAAGEPAPIESQPTTEEHKESNNEALLPEPHQSERVRLDEELKVEQPPLTPTESNVPVEAESESMVAEAERLRLEAEDQERQRAAAKAAALAKARAAKEERQRMKAAAAAAEAERQKLEAELALVRVRVQVEEEEKEKQRQAKLAAEAAAVQAEAERAIADQDSDSEGEFIPEENTIATPDIPNDNNSLDDDFPAPQEEKESELIPEPVPVVTTPITAPVDSTPANPSPETEFARLSQEEEEVAALEAEVLRLENEANERRRLAAERAAQQEAERVQAKERERARLLAEARAKAEAKKAQLEAEEREHQRWLGGAEAEAAARLKEEEEAAAAADEQRRREEAAAAAEAESERIRLDEEERQRIEAEKMAEFERPPAIQIEPKLPEEEQPRLKVEHESESESDRLTLMAEAEEPPRLDAATAEGESAPVPKVDEQEQSLVEAADKLPIETEFEDDSPRMRIESSINKTNKLPIRSTLPIRKPEPTMVDSERPLNNQLTTQSESSQPKPPEEEGHPVVYRAVSSAILSDALSSSSSGVVGLLHTMDAEQSTAQQEAIAAGERAAQAEKEAKAALERSRAASAALERATQQRLELEARIQKRRAEEERVKQEAQKQPEISSEKPSIPKSPPKPITPIVEPTKSVSPTAPLALLPPPILLSDLLQPDPSTAVNSNTSESKSVAVDLDKPTSSHPAASPTLFSDLGFKVDVKMDSNSTPSAEAPISPSAAIYAARMSSISKLSPLALPATASGRVVAPILDTALPPSISPPLAPQVPSLSETQRLEQRLALLEQAAAARAAQELAELREREAAIQARLLASEMERVRQAELAAARERELKALQQQLLRAQTLSSPPPPSPPLRSTSTHSPSYPTILDGPPSTAYNNRMSLTVSSPPTVLQSDLRRLETISKRSSLRQPLPLSPQIVSHAIPVDTQLEPTDVVPRRVSLTSPTLAPSQPPVGRGSPGWKPKPPQTARPPSISLGSPKALSPSVVPIASPITSPKHAPSAAVSVSHASPTVISTSKWATVKQNVLVRPTSAAPMSHKSQLRLSADLAASIPMPPKQVPMPIKVSGRPMVVNPDGAFLIADSDEEN